MSARLDGWVGVMIPVSDLFTDARHSVPGWTCVVCHWTHGTAGAPMRHTCPAEGEKQWEGHELPEYIQKQLDGRAARLAEASS